MKIRLLIIVSAVLSFAVTSNAQTKIETAPQSRRVKAATNDDKAKAYFQKRFDYYRNVENKPESEAAKLASRDLKQMKAEWADKNSVGDVSVFKGYGKNMTSEEARSELYRLSEKGQATADLIHNVERSHLAAERVNRKGIPALAVEGDEADVEEMIYALGLEGGVAYTESLAKYTSPAQREAIGAKIKDYIEYSISQEQRSRTQYKEYLQELNMQETISNSKYFTGNSADMIVERVDRHLKSHNQSLSPAQEKTLRDSFNTVKEDVKKVIEGKRALKVLGEKFKSCKNCRQ